VLRRHVGANYLNDRANAEKLYARLKVLQLNDTYKLQIVKMMHQFNYRCLPSAYNKLFTKLGNTPYIHTILDKKHLKNI